MPWLRLRLGPTRGLRRARKRSAVFMRLLHQPGQHAAIADKFFVRGNVEEKRGKNGVWGKIKGQKKGKADQNPF